LSVYLGAVALFYHSLFTDPDLKSAEIEWLDGGRVFVEIRAFVIRITIILRARRARRARRKTVATTHRPGEYTEEHRRRRGV
jgi:hypothetical protein